MIFIVELRIKEERKKKIQNVRTPIEIYLAGRYHVPYPMHVPYDVSYSLTCPVHVPRARAPCTCICYAMIRTKQRAKEEKQLPYRVRRRI